MTIGDCFMFEKKNELDTLKGNDDFKSIITKSNALNTDFQKKEITPPKELDSKELPKVVLSKKKDTILTDKTNSVVNDYKEAICTIAANYMYDEDIPSDVAKVAIRILNSQPMDAEMLMLYMDKGDIQNNKLVQMVKDLVEDILAPYRKDQAEEEALKQSSSDWDGRMNFMAPIVNYLMDNMCSHMSFIDQVPIREKLYDAGMNRDHDPFIYRSVSDRDSARTERLMTDVIIQYVHDNGISLSTNDREDDCVGEESVFGRVLVEGGEETVNPEFSSTPSMSTIWSNKHIPNDDSQTTFPEPSAEGLRRVLDDLMNRGYQPTAEEEKTIREADERYSKQKYVDKSVVWGAHVDDIGYTLMDDSGSH